MLSAYSMDTSQLPRSIRMALRHINVSARRMVGADEFLASLTDLSADGRSPVVAWLEEAEPSQIAMVVATGQTTFDILHRIAQQTLPPIHPTRVFLDDLLLQRPA